MSWQSGKTLGFDLETLGVDLFKSKPCSFALVHFDGPNRVGGRYGLIDPGEPIPIETTKIHGITDEAVKERGGPLVRSIAGITEALLAASAEKIPVVGANVRFDLSIIDSQCKAIDGRGLRDLGWNGPVIDVMVIDRHLDKWRKGSRKLVDLCAHYSVTMGEAHHAGSDADAAVRVAFALAAKYPEIGNADAEQLTVLQAAWRRSWAVDFSAYLVKQGKEPLDESEGDWPILGDKEIKV